MKTLVNNNENVAENELLIEAWIKVFDCVVSRLGCNHILAEVLPEIQPLMLLKSPFPKRKRGTRLLSSIITIHGEEALSKEASLWGLVQGVCQDTNYKIRMEGILLFKRLLVKDKAE
mmetsp:Transcript_20051/g.14757  ORF Transcript_20051/g.14757 Transcript_20051/m.14757 type:complete len:117 (+) Transcript_20051:346-696(+)